MSKRKPKKRRRAIYRFHVLNRKMELEPWTGTYPSINKAYIWYIVHGVWFEERGKRLVMAKTYEKSGELEIIEDWKKLVTIKPK